MLSKLLFAFKVPRARGLKPHYGSSLGGKEAAAARKDQWAHLATRLILFLRKERTLCLPGRKVRMLFLFALMVVFGTGLG